MEVKANRSKIADLLNKRFNRREFFRLNIAGALYLSFSTSNHGLFLPDKGFAADIPPDISVVKGAASAATRASVEMLGGMSNFVSPGNSVLIKPNMSFARDPSKATTTHPDVVKELAIMCKEAGASRVLILDHMLDTEANCLDQTGILDSCKDISDTVISGADNPDLYVETVIPGSVAMSKTDLLKEAIKADVLIAAPVAKSHSSTGVSLSMKGMMGLIYDRRSMHRGDLDSMIVDMCTVLKADLTVIDGSRVLSTKGPRGPGEVLIENTIIASRDMVAADSYAVSAFRWAGRSYKPAQVAHIRKANERGIGRMDIENLNVEVVEL